MTIDADARPSEMDTAFQDLQCIGTIADTQRLRARQPAQRNLARWRLPSPLHRSFPAPVAPGFAAVDRVRVEWRTAVMAGARHQRDRIKHRPGGVIHAVHQPVAQLAFATARFAITPTRCARYSALA